jgi:hypothetical protein
MLPLRQRDFFQYEKGWFSAAIATKLSAALVRATSLSRLTLASHVMKEWPVISVLRMSPEERLIP